MTKRNKISRGDTLNLDGVSYVVMNVCRGEGQARTVARMDANGPKRYYRIVMGQWVVLRESNPVIVTDLK